MNGIYTFTFMIGMILVLAGVSLSVYFLADRARQRRKKVRSSSLVATGASGNQTLEESWLHLVSQIFATFQKKSHDYGTDNPINGGIKGVILRMGDKSARLWQNFVMNDSMHVDAETAEDTLIDLANYALIAILLIRGEWPEPTRSFPFSQDALLDVLEDLIAKENGAL